MSMATIEAFKAARSQELREEHAELSVAAIRALDDYDQQQVGSSQSRLVRASTMLQATATKAGHLLAHLAKADHKAADSERLFRHDLSITRNLKRPNPMATTALVVVGWTFETVFTATSLLADGKADVIEALGFGATFSSTNVFLGLGAGFVARFIPYRKSSRTPQPDDRIIRGLAIGGLTAFALAHLAMVFTGGRVRVSGHEDIFNFYDVSFGATFADAMAIVIMVSAVVSFLIACVKGYSGIADPIPGYADHVGKAGEQILQTAEGIVEDALEAVDKIAENAVYDLKALTDPSEDLEALREDVSAFNARIETAKDQVRLLALQEWEKRCLIEGAPVRRPRVDLSAFDDLIIDLDQLVSPEAQPALTDALLEAQVEATAMIETAFAAFSAAIHRGVVLPPLSDNET